MEFKREGRRRLFYKKQSKIVLTGHRENLKKKTVDRVLKKQIRVRKKDSKSNPSISSLMGFWKKGGARRRPTYGGCPKKKHDKRQDELAENS